MSQDQQPKQPPEKIEPTLTPKSQKGQLESVLQQVRQVLQQTWNQAQPILKSQSIKALQVTIRTLEGLLAKLEAQSPKPTSTKESLDTQPTVTVESSESQVVSEAPSAPASGVPDHTAPVPPSESILDRLRPRLEQLQGWWNIALGKIRSWLPESTNQKLSDTALTGVVVGILVILFWTTSSLLPGEPSKVVDVPPAQPLPATDLTAPPELSVPALPQPVEVSPPALEPVATPSPTAKLDVPEPPQPVESPPPEPVATPLPTPELSPEQQLIADIQTQAAKVGNQYTDSLVQSVQVNLQGSHLMVRASDGWYNLSPSQQDGLANELLNQAQKFNLNKLELIGPRDVLLARSPVVGDNVVILKRQIRSAVVAS